MLLSAAGAVVLIVLFAIWAGLHREKEASTGPDAYAASLSTGNIQLSEATNGTGGKVTYIDGAVRNNGNRTVSGATVQLVFPADNGTVSAPVTLPLTLIRTRVPYVDLEPVSAEPLHAGESHDFRLIVEAVPGNWNQQPPQMRIVHTTLQ